MAVFFLSISKRPLWIWGNKNNDIRPNKGLSYKGGNSAIGY